MNRKLLSLLLAAALVTGCRDELMPESASPGSGGTGEAVTVRLSFGVSPYDSPAVAGRSGGIPRALSVTTPTMDVELTAVPDTASDAGTRAIPGNVDRYVSGYHVLQFDGVMPGSILKQRAYYSCPGGVLTTTAVTLYKQAGKQRVVVIANVPENYLDGLGVDAARYEDLQAMSFSKPATGESPFPLLANGAEDLMVMCGQTDLTLDAGSDMQASVVLLRTVSKVSFNIAVVDTMRGKFNTWDVSLANLPSRSYLNMMGGRKAIFPSADDLGTGGYYTDILYTIQNNDDLPLLSAYVPVNLQPDVPGTTFYDRRPNAPIGSTYLQIVGQERTGTGIVKDMVTYRIPLGLNFAENYSLPGNYHLNYTIRLKGLSDQDPHVVKLIPGYFGGECTAYDAAGNKVALNSDAAETFRYEKRVEVTATDAVAPDDAALDAGLTRMRWATGYLEQDNSLTDGFANTNQMMMLDDGNRKTSFMAAYTCYAGLNGLLTKPYAETDWYLPSIGELMGTWLSAAAYAPTMSPQYWSSSTSGRSLFYITSKGKIARDPVDATHWVRGMRTINY